VNDHHGPGRRPFRQPKLTELSRIGTVSVYDRLVLRRTNAHAGPFVSAARCPLPAARCPLPAAR
jgi:hypothetical protein